jgi:MFS transporter, DHA1 family, multidrug resistance protein
VDATTTTTAPTAPDEVRRGASRGNAMLIAVLGALTATGSLGIDMYVPGFPELGRSLHAGSTAVQLSMTAFLAGIVVGQPLIGPLSDALGRRRLLVPGTVLFALLSLVCAFVPGAPELIVTRFLQGIAGAAGMVLARAVITDRFDGADLPRYFSMLSVILAVAPVAAPVLGGMMLSLSGWRAIFVLLTVIAGLLATAVVVWVPESLPPEQRNRNGTAATFRAMGRLLRRREFTGIALTLGFTCGGALFSYISGSSFVFEDVYGTSATQYSLIFATNAIGMLVAGGLFGWLSRRLRVATLMCVGVAVIALSVVAQTVVTVIMGGSLIGTWACLFVTLFGIGMTMPAAMSLGQQLGREESGAASGALGSAQFLLGAIASPLVGAFGTGSALPMAAVMLVAVVCGVATLFMARPWRAELS